MTCTVLSVAVLYSALLTTALTTAAPAADYRSRRLRRALTTSQAPIKTAKTTPDVTASCQPRRPGSARSAHEPAACPRPPFGRLQ